LKTIVEILESMKDILSNEINGKKIYDKDLAKSLGINHLTLATMKKRGKVPYDKILDFCAKRKISINWLLYDQVVDSIRDETEKYARIRYFSDIYASAGGGAENYDENSQYINVDEKIIQKLNIGGNNIKNIEAINVIGESMEPTLKEGNVVFIDKSNKDIQKGGIYILLTQNGLFIKRVLYKIDGSCDIISESGFFEVIGKAVGLLSKL